MRRFYTHTHTPIYTLNTQEDLLFEDLLKDFEFQKLPCFANTHLRLFLLI